jgi:uncharacterized lipoprotein YmbA
MRLLVLCLSIWLTGCATHSATATFDLSDMNNFKPDCEQAKVQGFYLQQRITAFHNYFDGRSLNLEQRQYYTKLKNNLWSLRSSCSALQQ